MQTVPLGDAHHVSLYQSIFELPAGRHATMQQYLVQAAGIGSSIGAVQRHFEQLAALMVAAQQEPHRLGEAADELANLHYNVQFMLEKFDPTQLAFGCLVAAVDGVPVTDLSEQGLKELLLRLSAMGLTQGQVSELLTDVKQDFRRS